MKYDNNKKGFLLLDALLLLCLCMILMQLLLVASQTMANMEEWIIEDSERITGFYF